MITVMVVIKAILTARTYKKEKFKQVWMKELEEINDKELLEDELFYCYTCKIQISSIKVNINNRYRNGVTRYK